MAYDIIKELEMPVTHIDPEKNPYGIYVDKPVVFDEYNRQKVITGTSAAVNFIFRSFYGDFRLLPRIQGLFIDVNRYKHTLDSEYNKMRINSKVNEAIGTMLIDLNPQINIDFNPVLQQMNYSITMENGFEIINDDASSPKNAEFKINTKKFYE